MNNSSKNMPARQMTRREFVGGAVTTAGVIAGAPAFLRGQNLNSKLDIAFIACGGRANASLGELTLVPGRPPAGGKKGGKKHKRDHKQNRKHRKHRGKGKHKPTTKPTATT